MAKTINKKCTKFIFIDSSDEGSNLEKSRFSRKASGRCKNNRSLLKKTRRKGYPDPIDPTEKNVCLVYNKGYSEPYLLFDFLIQSSSFCLLKDLILQKKYQQVYDRSSQERLRKWLGKYHLSFSYKKGQIYGAERKIRYLIFCFLRDFPHFYVEDTDQAFSEVFIQLLEQRKRGAEVELLNENQTVFFELFPELLFFRERHLTEKEKIYRCILRLSCNIIIEKRWEKIEETQDYRKLMIVTEKLDSLFWLTSEYESMNKKIITRVIYQEWLRYTIGIHEHTVKEELQTYHEFLKTIPNCKEKLSQFQTALQQALDYPASEWGLCLLKVLQGRGYLELYPPEVKIVFFFVTIMKKQED